jgi:hypothetical protein
MTEPIVEAVDVAHVQQACRIAIAAEAPGGGAGDREMFLDWSEVDVDGFLAAAALHRVAPLLASQRASLNPPEGISSVLRARARADSLLALRLSAETNRAVRVLAEAQVPALVYKGIALSLQTTGGLVARGFGDIDVLVRPEDVPAAHAALEAAGWEGDAIPDAPRWWRHYLRVRRERSYRGNLSSIDLHWRIGWHARPLPPASELIARSGAVRIADADVPTLWLPDALTVACYSATVDRYARLRGLVDIVRLAASDDVHLPPGMDWRLRRLVAESVALAADLLGGVPDGRLRALSPDGLVDEDRLRRIYAHASVRRPWIDDDIPLGEIIGIYRDSGRFAGLPAAAGMAAIDGLLPPERIPPGSGLVGGTLAVGREIGDLVSRRVLSRPSRDSG